MMKQEQDHDLDAWLASYRSAGIDASSHQVLLDKIVEAAEIMPQLQSRTFGLNRQMLMSHLQTFFSYRRAWGLVPNISALVAIALVGFIVGVSSAGTPTPIRTAAQQTMSTNVDYLDQIVFGPKSWKEVSL